MSDLERGREYVEVGPPRDPAQNTDSTTNELRARGWSPDPAVVYACGCTPGELCRGHADRRAVEHYNPELGPHVSMVSGTTELSRPMVEGRPQVVDDAAGHAWRSWFRALVDNRQRPVGWPVERRQWVTWPDPADGAREVDDDDPRRERLRITVESPTVPVMPAD